MASKIVLGLTFCRKNVCFAQLCSAARYNNVTTSCSSIFRSYCSGKTLKDPVDTENTAQRVTDTSLSLVSEDTSLENQHDEVQNLRNVSGLPTHLRNRMEHVLKPPEVDLPVIRGLGVGLPVKKLSMKRQRRLYARYGKASSVDPGVMWPSNDELAETIKDEEMLEPSLQQLWKRAENKRRKERDYRMSRLKEVKEEMAKMPQFIERYRQRKLKEIEKDVEAEEKKKALLLEAREYYGYDVDVKDERFALMLERKAEEAKLAKKKRKKEEKKAKLLGMLDQMKEEHAAEAGKDKQSGNETEKS